MRRRHPLLDALRAEGRTVTYTAGQLGCSRQTVYARLDRRLGYAPWSAADVARLARVCDLDEAQVLAFLAWPSGA